MINRKGVSDVVSTVLIILLVVAAVAIIAAVVINIVRPVGPTVEAAAMCQKLMQDTTVSCVNTAAAGQTPAYSTVRVTRGFQNSDVVFASYDAIYACANGDNDKQPFAIATDLVAGVNNRPGVNSACTGTVTTASSVYILPKVKVGGVDTACPAPTSSVTCT